MEALPHDAAVQYVVQGHEAHSLVVSHVCVNDHALPASPFLPTRIVQRLIEPHSAVHTSLHQTLEVFDRFGRIHQQSERGGIGCYHQIILQPPFQTERWNAERSILVNLVRIESAVCGF